MIPEKPTYAKLEKSDPTFCKALQPLETDGASSRVVQSAIANRPWLFIRTLLCSVVSHNEN